MGAPRARGWPQTRGETGLPHPSLFCFFAGRGRERASEGGRTRAFAPAVGGGPAPARSAGRGQRRGRGPVGGWRLLFFFSGLVGGPPPKPPDGQSPPPPVPSRPDPLFQAPLSLRGCGSGGHPEGGVLPGGGGGCPRPGLGGRTVGSRAPPAPMGSARPRGAAQGLGAPGVLPFVEGGLGVARAPHLTGPGCSAQSKEQELWGWGASGCLRKEPGSPAPLCLPRRRAGCAPPQLFPLVMVPDGVGLGSLGCALRAPPAGSAQLSGCVLLCACSFLVFCVFCLLS